MSTRIHYDNCDASKIKGRDLPEGWVTLEAKRVTASGFESSWAKGEFCSRRCAAAFLDGRAREAPRA